jgi:hypothetical protein
MQSMGSELSDGTSTESLAMHGISDIVPDGTAECGEDTTMHDIGSTLLDEPADGNAQELARIIDIERLLDRMNLASEDLNSLQKALGTIQKARCKAVRAWTVGSARLIKAVGKFTANDLIKKAAPHHRQQIQLDTTHRQFAIASAAFLKASEGTCSEARNEKLAARHASRVAEYQAAQQSALKLLQAGSAPPSWLLESTAPYFEAEAAHHMHLEELRVAEERCCHRIALAKSRYHDAMHGLEAMSEAEHQARANSK